MEKYCK